MNLIPRLRASSIIVSKGQLLVVSLRDPKTGVTEVYLPGGGVDSGEAPHEAARRETLEETGYTVTIDSASMRTARYKFTFGERTYDCTTHFFLGHIVDPYATPIAHETESINLGPSWIPLADVRRRMAYHRGILEVIMQMIEIPPTRFSTFAEFWPFYLREHAHTTNRRMHLAGTSLAIVVAIAALLSGRFLLLLLMPIIGYGFAWTGHFFLQKNRPAAFKQPLYSLRADFKMLGCALRGSLDSELKQALDQSDQRSQRTQ